MKLDRINYRRLFPTGNFANESIELSGTLEPNEDPLNAYTELHKMAQELHLSKNAEIYEQMGTHEKIITAHRPKDTKEALIYDISSCTDLKVLETYKFLSSKYPEIEQAYIQKHKELYNEGN